VPENVNVEVRAIVTPTGAPTWNLSSPVRMAMVASAQRFNFFGFFIADQDGAAGRADASAKLERKGE